MSVHVIYRACGGTNRKRRPAFFSKTACLASLLRAVADDDAARVTFLCDGPLPDDATDMMRAHGEVVALPGLGNSRSYLVALDHATASAAPDTELTYFCEDDYLHVPGAIAALAAAGADAPHGTYLTLYDHPDRYLRDDDLPVGAHPVRVFGGRHWARVESTNMTFATHLGTLREDRRAHRMAARFTSYPHDRALWRSVQGLGARRALTWIRPERRLYGAIPSLATHMELDALAPLVEWETVARDAEAWARMPAGLLASAW